MTYLSSCTGDRRVNTSQIGVKLSTHQSHLIDRHRNEWFPIPNIPEHKTSGVPDLAERFCHLTQCSWTDRNILRIVDTSGPEAKVSPPNALTYAHNSRVSDIDTDAYLTEKFLEGLYIGLKARKSVGDVTAHILVSLRSSMQCRFTPLKVINTECPSWPAGDWAALWVWLS